MTDSNTKALRVGVVGAGRMGMPIIGHLVRKGFTTSACDIDATREKAVVEAGAQWEPDAAALASCEVVLVCVGYDAEVRALLCKGGPLAGVWPGSIVAVLSTVMPETVRTLSESASRRGIHVIDSTVCRGGDAADRGTLLSFVGGDAAIVDRIMPVLRAYSSDVVHTGGVGTAQVAKAVNNLILWACLVADHEALALARRQGVDVEALRRALMTSSCANGPLERWGSQTMAWADDDMAIVAEMAADAGIQLPQAAVTREICKTLKPKRYQLEHYGR